VKPEKMTQDVCNLLFTLTNVLAFVKLDPQSILQVGDKRVGCEGDPNDFDLSPVFL
jgi:hypothetical protein